LPHGSASHDGVFGERDGCLPCRTRRDLKKIEAIDGPNAFAYCKTLPNAPIAGLEITGLGRIGLPLQPQDALAIIGLCSQSPSGEGEQTAVDTNVRNSWELDASQFNLVNPAWAQLIARLTKEAWEELHVHSELEDVVVQPHKLLLYEAGAFSKGGQDSEKVPGTFGNLVVALPSLHVGGEVVLSHGKKEMVWSSAHNSEWDVSWAAWFTDVSYKAKPVTSGYRLVLTYHLVQDDDQVPQRAPDNEQVESIASSLKLYEDGLKTGRFGVDGPEFLMYHIFQGYTQAELQLSCLKGLDRARVAILAEACQINDFDIYLAQVEKSVSKYTPRLSFHAEELERFEDITYLCDLNGTRVESKLSCQKECHLDDCDTDYEDPDESERDSDDGYGGESQQHWYRYTVVLLVPPQIAEDDSLNVAAGRKRSNEGADGDDGPKTKRVASGA
jgi:hypothetical protein